jgi:predicted acetyltransferase
MGQISIRKLDIEEAAPAFNWMTSYAFTETPPMRDPETFKERFKHAGENNTYLAVYEGGTAVATAGAGLMTQNVRAELVDSAGVFMVATHPAHRRKGYSFQALRELFGHLRENGCGYSTLYPFRESFYERLGYANWPAVLIAELNIRSLAPLIKQVTGVELELFQHIDRPDVYHNFITERYKPQTHGVGTFKTQLPPDPERHKTWVLTATIKGVVDGIMVYNLSGNRPTEFQFDVGRFYTLSPASRYAFLGWIARHIDQTDKVSISLPPFEQPHVWFSDLNINLSNRKISPMGRVLDIEKLNGLPVGEGYFTVNIRDNVCPWNERIWSFRAEKGRLKVSKAQKADCDLSIQGLSALVYGGPSPESFVYRGWGMIPGETVSVMRSLFPPIIPHLHEFF